MNLDKLTAELRAFEGLRLRPYRCTEGVLTIGYGHTGPDVRPGIVWSKEQAESALQRDIAEAVAGLDRRLPWWRTLDDVRARVLADMAFNMGLDRLCGFKHALAAMQAGDYSEAARELLDSKWAKQVKGRAVHLADRMETGRDTL